MYVWAIIYVCDITDYEGLREMYSELLNIGGRFHNMTSSKLENSVIIKLIRLRMYILKCNSVFYSNSANLRTATGVCTENDFMFSP